LTVDSILGPRVLLGGPGFKLVGDDPVVAYDPGVVTRLDHIRLSRSNLAFRPVLVGDVQATLLQNADVASLAAVGSNDGLDAFGPAPTRFERVAGCRSPAHPYDIDARLVGCARLVGRLEVAPL
jgi:hypothetical protein